MTNYTDLFSRRKLSILFLDFTINIGISVDEGADGCPIDSLYDSVAYEHTNEPVRIKLT